MRATPCQLIARRPSASGSTGSISFRSRASDRWRKVRSTSTPHHSRSKPSGPELALQHTPGGRQTRQQRLHDRDAQAETLRACGGGKWPVSTRIALDEIAHRVAHGLQQRVGQSQRQRCTKSVAIARRVLDRHVARLASHGHDDDAARRDERIDRGHHIGCGHPRAEFVARQIAQPQQQVVDAVGAARAMSLVERLQLPLECIEDVGIEQLAQLGIAQQVAQLRVVHRQRLGAPLGQRRVAIVAKTSRRN